METTTSIAVQGAGESAIHLHGTSAPLDSGDVVEIEPQRMARGDVLNEIASTADIAGGVPHAPLPGSDVHLAHRLDS